MARQAFSSVSDLMERAQVYTTCSFFSGLFFCFSVALEARSFSVGVFISYIFIMYITVMKQRDQVKETRIGPSTLGNFFKCKQSFSSERYQRPMFPRVC